MPYPPRTTVRSPARYAKPARGMMLSFGVVYRPFGSPFTPGNVVVYRVGTGSGSLLNSGNPVFLDEYTPGGTLVQSVALPTTSSGANRRLIASGTATSEGLMTRSADGRYLLLAGYDAPIPTAGRSVTSTRRHSTSRRHEVTAQRAFRHQARR